MPKRSAAKTFFAVLFLSALVLFSGCGEKGSPPDEENPGQIGDPAEGGKTPSDETLNDGVVARNLAGLSLIGKETTMTVYLTDRLGRYYGLPNGLNVHVATENGIGTDTDQASADNEGKVVFTLRTQGVPDDVGEGAWVAGLEAVLQTYSWSSSPSWTGYPSKGSVSVLYYTRGEEGFVDANANGTWDSGETFFDSPVDPFIDSNDNGVWDLGEEYVDDDGNHAYSGANGKWDNNKLIFRNTHLQVTGRPKVGVSAGASVADGGLLTVVIVVCDDNYNRISSGSTITVTAGGGLTIVGGDESITLTDSYQVGSSANSQLGIIANAVSFQHKLGSTDSPTYTVAVTWEGETITRKYTGSVL